MSTPRIVIESFPNVTLKYFHVNARISSERLYSTLLEADAGKYIARAKHRQLVFLHSLDYGHSFTI